MNISNISDIIEMSLKEEGQKEPPHLLQQEGRREGGEPMDDGYTEFGYRLDGIEYATIEEALEAQQ